MMKPFYCFPWHVAHIFYLAFVLGCVHRRHNIELARQGWTWCINSDNVSPQYADMNVFLALFHTFFVPCKMVADTGQAVCASLACAANDPFRAHEGTTKGLPTSSL
jgi:hypothetical protein